MPSSESRSATRGQTRSATRGDARRDARGETRGDPRGETRGDPRGRTRGQTPGERRGETSSTAHGEPASEGAALERLQKVLAGAGVGSRRACEEMIAQGRVVVNGRVAELGDKVDPHGAEIYVDGERVVADETLAYLAMNKPRGVVATMADERGRTAITDFLGNMPQRVFHVGRLDADSEGLLLLTNDGDLAHKLTHPSFGVTKTYLAEVPGPVSRGLGRRLLAGVELEDGPAKADAFRVVDSVPGRVLVEVVLHEGRKHIVRRLLGEVGYPVSRLIRTEIGPVKLGNLKPGRTRRLTRPEIAGLFRAVS